MKPSSKSISLDSPWSLECFWFTCFSVFFGGGLYNLPENTDIIYMYLWGANGFLEILEP